MFRLADKTISPPLPAKAGRQRKGRFILSPFNQCCPVFGQNQELDTMSGTRRMTESVFKTRGDKYDQRSLSIEGWYN